MSMQRLRIPQETHELVTSFIPNEHPVLQEPFAKQIEYVLKTVKFTTPEGLLSAIGLSLQDQEFILKICNDQRLDFVHEIRTGIMARFRQIDSYTKKDVSAEIYDPQIRRKEKVGTSNLIHKIVTRLMLENDQAKDECDKIAISIKLIQHLAHCGKDPIIAYRRENEAILKEHHKRHGWRDELIGRRHNQAISRKHALLMSKDFDVQAWLES